MAQAYCRKRRGLVLYLRKSEVMLIILIVIVGYAFRDA